MQLICLQTLFINHKRNLSFSQVFKESVNPQQMGLAICSGHEMICISALQSFKKECFYFYFYFYFYFEEPSSVSSPQTNETYSLNFCVLGILLCTDDMGFGLRHLLSHFHHVLRQLLHQYFMPSTVEKSRERQTNQSIHFGAVLLTISSH